LRGETGQSRNGFRDTRVGQLADVFCGNRFDDARRFTFELDRIFDAGTDASHQNRFDIFACCAGCGRVLRLRGTMCNQCGDAQCSGATAKRARNGLCEAVAL
jgi:hypothetical protein